ncbi:ABC transporter [Rhodonellum psychrophilum GCM71 = DSM 17998]|uniref:ATPase components of ABC transporters with duplicated ATPase domains n=2 Tax=Rhodonellum TaxID=336827 RepID=A0A1H3S4N0_9BACT|nr:MULTISPECIES: ATP-binding cassette domain-containing protein [Rhodonellum]ERM80895.1 ABC transporter [Rhodonellum psychrophilum GCM71 = DSM 17998]MDO9552887.1 ATP-binding cassette domain-containing protein [Rhodonellum sp.]SDZ33043.1 ATPase components of ABC transporters with duplicated ATPase domains [Rhodonellum ikkaensis]
MISVDNLSLKFGKRTLFDEVSLKFIPGNCYGVIGANGAGKSTFLKILSGEIDSTSGAVNISPGQRMAVLSQNHFEFDEIEVLKTVIMGHKKLYAILEEKDAIYMKEDFSEADGIRASELEGEFAEMDGWNAESDAASMLSGLGISENLHNLKMKELAGNQKVRVLLAQALFGNPDILILDEPTNDLDSETINWLEDFLVNFKNLVIVVSHDRHFLDAVSTHIVDIDFSKIRIYSGNYTFWYESSQLAAKQKTDQNKKVEEKRKELLSFIERFSANVAKSKQATSRKKMLEKLNVDDIQPSTRKYPGIIFKPEREAGDQIFMSEGLELKDDENIYFTDVNLMLEKGDKVAFVSKTKQAVTKFFQTIMEEIPVQKGSFKWGVTINKAYLPNDNSKYFATDQNLINWLSQYSTNQEEAYVRTFLGRMLFTGEDSLKKSSVLSGGEKVRCMISRMMLQNPNLLVMDEPTNHLDLESITAFNNTIIEFNGTVMMTSYDYAFVESSANRIVEFTPKGTIDKRMPYEDYLASEEVKALREKMYSK